MPLAPARYMSGSNLPPKPAPPLVRPVKAPVAPVRHRQGAKTLIEYAYRRLKSNIIRGHLAPGSKLRIERLRAEYGVASSTLREALSLLVADSLVTAEGQQGFRVVPMSIEDFREICSLRKMMETLALRESIADGDEDWEAGVVAAFHKLNLLDLKRLNTAEALVDAYNERNHVFHEALVGACRSPWVRRFRSVLYDNARRYRHLSVAKGGIRPNIQAEHRAIMEAALARDVDLACRLSEEHIDRTLLRLAQFPAEEIAAGFPGLPRSSAAPTRGPRVRDVVRARGV
jgi:GntR family carbon starvation induced transcriptional regulator